MIPSISYIVCSTPRSGSNMLCFGLKETGVCGAPVEYFNPFTTVPIAMKQHRFTDFGAYLKWVIEENTGPNGVFGVKMHQGQFHFLTDELKKIGPYRDLSSSEALKLSLGDPRYIYITRRDKVRQAVSWCIALQTENWMEEGGNLRPAHGRLRYDYFALYYRHQMLVRHEALWKKFFLHNSIKPLEIVYEEMVGDYARTVDRVLEYLGLDRVAARKVSLPPTKPQSSEINELWAKRFNSTPRWIGKGYQFLVRASGKLSHAS